MTEEEKKLFKGELETPTLEGGFGERPSGFEQALNEPIAGTVSREQAKADVAAEAAKPAEEKKGYADVLSSLHEAQQKDYEEKKKRLERNSRTAGIISGIADMAGALGNIYFANKGVPVKFSPDDGMAKRVRERYDRALAEMNQDNAQKLQYLDRLGRLMKDKEGADYKAAMLELQKAEHERKNREQQRLVEKDKTNAELNRIRLEIQQGTLDYKNAKLELDKMLAQGKITAEEHRYQLALAKQNSSNATTVEEETVERDSDGNIISRTKKKSKEGQSGNGGRTTADLGNGNQNKNGRTTAKL